MHFPTDKTEYTTVFDGPVVDHWLKLIIAQTANSATMQARSDDPNLYARVCYRMSSVLPHVIEVSNPDATPLTECGMSVRPTEFQALAFKI